MSHAYSLSALKVVSDLDLPDLLPWNGAGATPADVIFSLGSVLPQLAAPDRVAPIFSTKGRCEYLLALPGTGRILVRDGSKVTIEAEAGADPLDTSAILTGPIQAVLWHMRGLLPLHASAVFANGRAIALAGPPAAGKSTLAAVLRAKGCRVLADDICVVDSRGGADVKALPGAPQLRLWRDAIDHLGIPTDGLKKASSHSEQFVVDCRKDIMHEPQRLAAVVVLVRRPSSALAIERLCGPRAVGSLHDVVHMRGPAHALGLGPEIFAALTRLTTAGVTTWRLRIPDDPACLEAAAAKVLAVLEE